MDLSKSYEFFQPVDKMIHIIGCGSVGSTLAENLARCGETKFTLWDFDKVESHNVHNQMFTEGQIGMKKIEALRDLLLSINPCIEIKMKPNGWQGEMVSGYVFLAVDSIELRRKFCEQHKGNAQVKAVFDIRTGLTDAQHFAADWHEKEQRDALIMTMQFSDEEADAQNPRTACGSTLGVMTTVRIITAIAVNNYIKFVKKEGTWTTVLMDGFSGYLETFGYTTADSLVK